jgi:hypothetical protein
VAAAGSHLKLGRAEIVSETASHVIEQLLGRLAKKLILVERHDVLVVAAVGPALSDITHGHGDALDDAAHF